MRLEYFQLIDRIVELDVPGRAIKTLAQVPQTSTIFEGHFPIGVSLAVIAAAIGGSIVLSLARPRRRVHG